MAVASADGSKAFLVTEERLVGADTDDASDVYERSGGQTTLLSAAGTGATGSASNSSFSGASADGATVFFVTTEHMVGADTDGLEDLYQRSGDQTTLVSAPGAGATGPAVRAQFAGASTDGSRAFFETDENLVGTDTDGMMDVYERAGGQTTLVSAAGAERAG